MNIIIRQDLYRYFPEPYSMRVLFKGLRSPGFRFTYFLRKASFAENAVTRMLYRIILRLLVFRYGFQIPYNTPIGPGLHISHFGLLIINPGASIGHTCNLNQGVTIGQTNRGERAGCPTIGNHVWIGANAVIVGKIVIGDDVLIAPGAFVNVDVPSHSIVLGNPAKILPRENATQEYICNVLQAPQ